MADSNITKRALSAALKELLETRPFSKISVADICEKCDMHRKSFYYHFKDKYDLVNWIYCTEFVVLIQPEKHLTGWNLLEELCEYFYTNKSFYKKIIEVEGQNSFEGYFREVLIAIITEDLQELFIENNSRDFYIAFYTDAFVCAIKRWLLDKSCPPANEFCGLLKKCLLGTSNKILRDFSEASK